MLRKLVSLSAAVGLLLSVATTASASVFIATDSELQIQLAALPTIRVQGTWTGLATVSNGVGSGHDMTDNAGIFVTIGNSVGTSLLTGVALITNLTLTESNDSGSFTSMFSTPNPMGGNAATPTPSSSVLCPGGCLGGTEGLTGQFVLGILGVAQLPFPLDVIGVGGQVNVPLGQSILIATGAPFVTGKFKITGITTNVISMPGRGAVTGVGVTLKPAGTEEVRTFTTNGGFVTSNTQGNLETLPSVVMSGSNNITSASAGGTITLVSPMRIDTGDLNVGKIPGLVTKKFSFVAVPEPGTVLLLVSGAAGLVMIGRSRMRR
jgi:hypothetical protein